MMIFVMKNSVQTWLKYGELYRIPYTPPIPQLDAIARIANPGRIVVGISKPKNVHPRKLTYPHE